MADELNAKTNVELESLIEESKQAGEFARKQHILEDDELTVEGGDVVAVVASDTVDSESEVVIPKNIDLERFRKVRQVYYEHDMEQLPIGSAKWIKLSGDGHKLISKHYFAKSSELARAVGDLVKERVLRGYSVGCAKRQRSAPTTAEKSMNPTWVKAKAIWRGNPILVEYSVVGQAANPDCVAMAVSKSWSQATVDLLTGKTSNTKRAVAEITEELAPELATKHLVTETHATSLIAARLEQITKTINPDEIIQKVLANLSRRTT